MIADYIVSIQGTPEGHRLALLLAISAAVLHAIVSAMQKGKTDPWTSRAFIDLAYCVMSAPFALLLLPPPQLEVLPILFFALIAHSLYKILQAMAFSRAAFTVVYPVVRGTGPLVTVLAAGFVFGEVFSLVQWLGVGILVIGILGLAAFNILRIPFARTILFRGISLAVLTGFCVAAYTTIDAYGVRATPNPFTFLAWLFFLDGFLMPTIWLVRFGKLTPRRQLPRLMGRGAVGGVIAVASFGSIMLATRLDSVGEIAVLRETSIVFAALIGWLFLKEPVGTARTSLMVLIAAGAVIVELGG